MKSEAYKHIIVKMHILYHSHYFFKVAIFWYKGISILKKYHQKMFPSFILLNSNFTLDIAQ